MTRVDPTIEAERFGSAAALAQLIWRPLAWVALRSVMLNLLLIAPTLYMLQVFDRVIPAGSGGTLVVLLAGVVMLLLLGFALDVLRARLLGVTGRMAGVMLAPAITRGIIIQMAQPAARVDAQGLRDVASVQALFSATGVTALFDAPWLLVYVALIAATDWRMGAAAATFAFLMLALAGLSHQLLRQGSQGLQAKASDATQHLHNVLKVAESLLAMGMVDAALARWRALSDKAQVPHRSIERLAAVLSGMARLLRQLVQVGMLAVGAWLVITDAGSAGLMIGATVLLGRALAPLEQIVSGWRTLSEGAVAWKRLEVLLLASPQAAENLELPRPSGRVSMVRVNFRSPASERLILEEISLELEPGESLAIIGPSGAGKSSLLRVLAGIWAPSSGDIKFDGASLTQWNEGKLGRWTGYLAQDVQLFDGTVADNIARLQAPDTASILRAATRAGVHEAVLALPEGYETSVSSGAVSPGQRQRIALARALYGDPSLLLLDEPNANLDGAGEVALGAALRALRGQVSVVVVTHRKTLLLQVDKILVLEAGRVRHFGPRTEVLKAMQRLAELGAGAMSRAAAPRRPSGESAL